MTDDGGEGALDGFLDIEVVGDEHADDVEDEDCKGSDGHTLCEA